MNIVSASGYIRKYYLYNIVFLLLVQSNPTLESDQGVLQTKGNGVIMHIYLDSLKLVVGIKNIPSAKVPSAKRAWKNGSIVYQMKSSHFEYTTTITNYILSIQS